MGGNKHDGDGSEGAPQVYVRLMVELSYDAPRPDPDGALRRECGAAIRREVEKALGGDMLAAKLGDARVTLRALVMRQEMDPGAFGHPAAVDVQGATGGQPIRFSPSGPETVPVRPGMPYPHMPEPLRLPPQTGEAAEVSRRAAESIAAGETKEQFLANEAARIGYGSNDPPRRAGRRDTQDLRDGDGKFIAQVDDPYDSMKGGVSDAEEWARDVPPNAGSAE